MLAGRHLFVCSKWRFFMVVHDHWLARQLVLLRMRRLSLFKHPFALMLCTVVSALHAALLSRHFFCLCLCRPSSAPFFVVVCDTCSVCLDAASMRVSLAVIGKRARPHRRLAQHGIHAMADPRPAWHA